MPRRDEPPFWFTLFLYAFFFVLSELLRPKPELENAKPSGLGDIRTTTATEGRVVPLVWGTNQLAGPNVVWYGDLRQKPITQTVKTGLFSSEDVVLGFKYYLGIQFALCRGTTPELLRIWIGDDEVFAGTVTSGNAAAINKPKLFGGDDLGSGGVVGSLRFFSGSPSQLPADYLAAREATSATVGAGGTGYSVGDVLTLVGGTFSVAARFEVASVSSGAVTAVNLLTEGVYTVAPSNPAATTSTAGTGCTLSVSYSASLQDSNGATPAYRGTCYALLEGGYIGNSVSLKPWKFEVRRIPTGPAAGGNESVNGGMDANPVNVIYEVMTDKDWGLGFDPSEIDSSNFAAVGVVLKNEGNGFSMVLDSAIEATELIQEVERQIDGVVFFDQASGKWKINLARADYDIDTVPELSPATYVELKDFTRGAWEDTTNAVKVAFNDRSDSYKDTFATAQDMANVRLQNGTLVNGNLSFPGVKDRTLANNIAWRHLRSSSYPLAKMTIVVDRASYDVQPGQPLAFTDPDLGITKLPVRVTKIDFGLLEQGQIELSLVQDVFYTLAPSFADPGSSGWTPPADSLLPFDADKQKAFEAPRAFVTRDPASAGIVDKVWCGARRKGVEVGFDIVERHSAGSPSGAFAPAGECFGLLLLGRLNSSLAAGTAIPTATLTIAPAPDTQADLEAAFTDSSVPSDVGVNLLNLILVDSELMLVSSAQNSGANVQLNGVYRGALDTVQAAHTNGSRVWLLAAGGALTSSVFTPGHNVEVKLLPKTATDLVLEAAATTISLTMANRVRRPYPPSFLKLGGTLWASTISLEQTGSGGETYGFVVDINRRDYRTVDEVQALSADASTIFPDFPSANGTTHEYDLRNDPTGANTLLFSVTGVAGAQFTVLRIDVLVATDGVLPTTLRLDVHARHTDGSVSYASQQSLLWDFAATSGLTGQFNFGALDTSDVSIAYTATVNGTYNFTLSSSFSAGNVEYRLNGGAWTTLISAGGTSGSIPGVVSTDVIEVRHLSSDPGAKKFLAMDAPGAGQDAYGVFFV